jgi:hypothetical protein
MNNGARGVAAGPGGSRKTLNESVGEVQPVGMIDALPWSTTLSARIATRIDKPVSTGQSG